MLASTSRSIGSKSALSERRIVRHAQGRTTTRFERIPGERAEALDALVYATAAKTGLALSAAFSQREDELRASGPPKPQQSFRRAGSPTVQSRVRCSQCQVVIAAARLGVSRLETALRHYWCRTPIYRSPRPRHFGDARSL